MVLLLFVGVCWALVAVGALVLGPRRFLWVGAGLSSPFMLLDPHHLLMGGPSSIFMGTEPSSPLARPGAGPWSPFVGGCWALVIVDGS